LAERSPVWGALFLFARSGSKLRLTVHLRFYAELIDFLPPQRRRVPLAVALGERDAVKDVIEAQGVPHTEVDLVLVDGESVGFSYQVQDGDRIGVYPAFRSIDIAPVTLVRPPALPEARFVLDAHLGTLASHLRLLGFDVLYRNDYDDATLAEISRLEGRILLTRDRGLLKRSRVLHGYHVWETDPDQQVSEVLHRYGLFPVVQPFRRCTRCNTPLEPVEKASVEHRLQPKTRLYYHEFAICPACDRIYWKGSHFDKMRRLVERWLTATAVPPDGRDAAPPR
jgi:uncharacterized protein